MHAVAMAQSLGIKLVPASMRATLFDNFERLRAFVGPLPGGPPECPWAGGTYREKSVLCVASQEGGASLMTHVFVRIDPPLFLGLRITKVGGGDLFGPRSQVTIPFGGFSKGFLVAGWDPRRISALLQPPGRSPEILIKLLQMLMPIPTLGITDNLVRLSVQHVPHGAMLVHLLDNACWLADALAYERRFLPGPRDLPDWKAIADRLELTYDAQRMTMSGSLGQIPMLARMYTDNGIPFAEVVARLPRALGLGLQLRASAEEGWICQPPHLLEQPPIGDVRPRLQQLLARARVTIDDEHATTQLVSRAAWDVPLFDWLIGETAEIAAIVGKADTTALPYR